MAITVADPFKEIEELHKEVDVLNKLLNRANSENTALRSQLATMNAAARMNKVEIKNADL